MGRTVRKYIPYIKRQYLSNNCTSRVPGTALLLQ